MVKSLGEILRNIQSKDAGKYLKYEWQLYGYRLATWLDDMDRISLYMRLAKTEERKLLDKSWDFIKDAYKPQSKSKLFMWKLTQLRKERAEKEAVQETAQEKTQ